MSGGDGFPNGDTALSGAGVRLSARERLAITREQMRQTMWARVHPPKRTLAGGAVTAGGAPSSSWSARLRSVPVLGVVVDTVSTWWSRHPLRPFAAVAGEASRAVALPAAERHPIGMVLGAATVGAVLVKARAWRWVLRPAWFAGIVPLFATSLIERMPLESWISLLTETGSPASPGNAGHTPAPGTAAHP